MAKKVELKERDTNVVMYPVTLDECVLGEDGKNLKETLNLIVDDYIIADNANYKDLEDHRANRDAKHIPNGGRNKQVLSWKASGEAQWEDLTSIFTGLEEILAYGVEWDVNVADPHLTRIGNLTLHKTLPILSQLKGCIAQGNKIMYWLDENDWNYTKDRTITILEGDTSALNPGLEYPGIKFKENVDPEDLFGRWFACDRRNYKFKVMSYLKESDSYTVRWHPIDSNSSPHGITEEDICKYGSRLDGFDGTVKVYCPSFYIKSKIIGNKRQVWISPVRIDDTWTYLRELLIDAYRGTILNTVPEHMGYLSTLSVNSLISVANPMYYCRGGGNRPEYDKYLNDMDFISDMYRTDLGKPRTSISRASLRLYARRMGSEVLSYNLYKNIFYWLYVIEYANFNCQEAFKDTLTEEGYHLGGLGDGMTSLPIWLEFNEKRPVTPCGYGDSLGNRTGLIDIKIRMSTSATEFVEYDRKVPRWRGFDNPFGDTATVLEGIVIQNIPGDSTVKIYTTDDVSEYSEEIGNKVLVGEATKSSGWIKEFDLGETAEIIPSEIGGHSTNYKCDSHLPPTTDSLTIPYIGGYSDSGGMGGIVCSHYNLGTNRSSNSIGFRTVTFL